MNGDTLLKWGGIAFLVYLGGNFLANRVSNLLDIGKPQINLGQVQWAGPIPISVSATILVPVTNSNAISFPLQRIIASIVYGQSVLSTLEMTQPITIQAGETSIIQFETQLSFANLGGNIATIIASGEYLQALKLVGTADVEGVTIPFTNTISVG